MLNWRASIADMLKALGIDSRLDGPWDRAARGLPPET